MPSACRSKANWAASARLKPATAKRKTATAPKACCRRDQLLTDPDQARDFVLRTGVDALAVAIGTSHGAYKFNREPTGDILAMDVVKAIHERLPNTHLVMHGSSSVPQDLQDIFNAYGGAIPQTWGVPVSEIQLGIKHGVRKINIDTDCRIAMTGQFRKMATEKKAEFDPRAFFKPAIAAMTALCAQRFEEFGTAGQAPQLRAVAAEGDGRALRQRRPRPGRQPPRQTRLPELTSKGDHRMNVVTPPAKRTGRYDAGVMKYKEMGYFDLDYEPKDTDILAVLPHHPAGRRGRGRSRRRRCRRKLHRDLDRGLDRPSDRLRKVSRQGYRVDPVPGAPGQYFAFIAYDIELFEPNSIVNLSASIIGNVFGFKPLKALRLEDMRLPIAYVKTYLRSADRDRGGAGTARQIRPSAAGRDREAEARPVRPQLWPRGV